MANTITAPAEALLAELLLRWEEQHDRGREPAVEELCVGHPELAEELRRQIAALRALGDPLRTTPGPGIAPGPRPAAGPPAPGRRATCTVHYDDLRFHAAGGLGEVFLARGDDLPRDVALKFLHAPHARDPESLRRFLREAELTGRLEHPGIVPVYGLGCDADGCPCYAMRFIRGRTLDEAIREFHAAGTAHPDPAARSTAFRALLRRFVAVCNTVAYAHSRGVIHRDLKPSNILLDPFDETLVVDWGLARPFEPGPGRPPAAGPAGDDPDRTAPGPGSGPAGPPTAGAIGTPAFMSPEQVAGPAERVGPASDIYSLGATLYCLLTGRSPVQGRQLLEVLGDVREGRFPPPRQVRPDVPRAPEAICLKAMALRPEDRYASALDLVAEIDRWLADEPVSVYREPPVQRVGRWMRRHRTLMIGVAAAGVMALAASAFGYWRESTYAARLARSHAETDRWLDRAMAAIQGYYTGLNEETLRDEALSPALRERLLEEPRRFFTRITAELKAQPHPGQRERFLLAQGRLGLGRIESVLGHPAEARREFEAAIAEGRFLVAAHPGVAAYQDVLATSYFGLGDAHDSAGDPVAAIAADRKALLLGERLVAAHPGSLEYRSKLAGLLNHLGFALGQTGDTAGAVTTYERAIATYRGLIAERPREPEYQDGLAACRTNLGLAHMAREQWAAAAESFREVITTYQRLVADHPGVPDYRKGLAIAHTDLGNLRGKTGDATAAVASHREAIALFQRLATDQPRVPEYRKGLAAGYMNLGWAQTIVGYDRLIEARPGVPEDQKGLAQSYIGLGDSRDVRGGRGDPKAAAAAYREAIALWERLVAAHPEIPGHREAPAGISMRPGGVRATAGEPEAGAEALRRSLTLWDELIKDYPQVPDYRASRALTLNNLAVADRARGDRAAAVAALREAVATLEQLIEQQPGSPFYQDRLAACHFVLALLETERGHSDAAAGAYQKAIALRTRMVARWPDRPNHWFELGAAHNDWAFGLEQAGRGAEAVAPYRQALTALRHASELASRATRYRWALDEVHVNLARTLRSLGRGDEAADVTRERIRLQPDDPRGLYDGARELALCLPAPPDGGPRGRERREELAAEAIGVLRQAVAAGWSGATRAAQDPDLAALRDRDDFRRLLAELLDRGFPTDPFAP